MQYAALSRDHDVLEPLSRYARWAEAIHHQFPEVEGLIWTSNQCDPDTSYLFFGDRVVSADFRVMRVRDGMLDATFLSDVRQAGHRSGITITV